MKSTFSLARGSVPLSMLALTCCLAGCSLTTLTRTGGISDAAVVQSVCRSWAPVTYSSKDTPQTQLEVRAGNAAREAWGCAK